MKLNTKHKRELKRKQERKLRTTLSHGTFLLRKEKIQKQQEKRETNMRLVSMKRKEAVLNLAGLNNLNK